VPPSEPTDPQLLAPGLTLVPLRTPTLPPATRTHCVVVGEEEVLVVDPGSPWPDEQQRLQDWLGARAVRGVLLTHHHGDHVGGARSLADAHGCPVVAHAATAEAIDGGVDATLVDGQVVPVPGGADRTLTAWHTPGHAQGHLSFADSESGAFLVGDLVAGVGTVIVAPPDGNMDSYLASLERLIAAAPRLLVPAHGPPPADPVGLLVATRDHRRWREGLVIEALRDEPDPLSSITARAYPDVPKALHVFAGHSARAHLDRLVRQGRARVVGGDRWLRA